MARRRRRRGAAARPLWIGLGGALALVVALFLVGRALRVPAAVPETTPVARPTERHPAPRARSAPDVPSGPLVPAPAAVARVALVIDDLGRSERDIDRLEALRIPVSFAVLPYERRTAEIAARLQREGREILCHLPMEAVGGQNPGPNAILDTLDPQRIAERTREAIDAVPGATGLNNHMGSRITADPDAMRAILGVVGERGLFFLDSRTTAETRGFEMARRLGIPAAERAVFLDAERGEVPVTVAFHHLLAVAREKGAAVGIGHPHDSTLRVLEELVPQAVAQGYEFVPVSYLLERNEGLPE